MVHTRNGSNYSVQPDGCGQGRGKTKFRSIKSSSRQTYLEDSRVSPHSPRSVPTNFDVNSESGLIHDNILRAESLASCRNGNLSMQIQKLAQISQRRGVGNITKPLAGGYELLLTHQELSGSGEDHRALRRLEPIVFQKQSQKDKELVEEPKSFIHRPEEGVGNDSSFEDRRPNGICQLQKCPKTSLKNLKSSRTVPRTIKARAKANLGQCLQYGQDPYGIHSQGAGKDEQNLSTEIIQEINFVKTNIKVEIGKIDSKLTKITLDINDLKKNEKNPAEMHKSVIARLELLTKTCDRIESKYHVQDDEMEDFATRNINDKLGVLKDYVVAVAENTNQFATHLARSDSERKKLKEEILAQVEQIHKNY
ncbi:hypothetical protein O181_104350 [Austropuccinia psidii MF-1]|uniref:Uncharacterized protein n=1 Tax=Austropuccinia psidii MF-1 TaxID=1389203 RepID=A0A9Q3PKL3_9BASI|nr:hypothetical protein [Austropuccinia psidii MF-1]